MEWVLVSIVVSFIVGFRIGEAVKEYELKPKDSATHCNMLRSREDENVSP